MLDPEALRSREIGDDPYAPTRPAQKAVPPFDNRQRRRIGVAVSAARYGFSRSPRLGVAPPAQQHRVAQGLARSGAVASRQPESSRGGSCCGN